MGTHTYSSTRAMGRQRMAFKVINFVIYVVCGVMFTRVRIAQDNIAN